MISESFQVFLNNWNEDKEALKDQMRINKEANERLRVEKGLSTKDELYKSLKKSLKVSENPTAETLLMSIPDQLLNESNLSQETYKVEGSVGKGNISEIPWVCVFDKEITKSAEKGYYIVYLVKADFSGAYLSLNQGWTQYEKTYKKDARREILKNANKLKKHLKGVDGYSFNDIDLIGRSSLARGYELGNICSKYYGLDTFPNDQEIIDDLRNLIGVYRELKTIVGLDILGLKNVLDEEEYQNEIQSESDENLPDGPIEKKDKKKSNSSSSWQRNPKRAAKALKNAFYKCENDSSHQTFISAKSKKQFVEAHHLIPMEFQDEIKKSIDVPENIICLCPNCHRAFHSAEDVLKQNLVLRFLEDRKELLKNRRIIIEESKLLEYYRIINSSNDV